MAAEYPTEYGDDFEKPLIFIICLAIIAAIAGATMLVTASTPTCRSANLTYCGHESGF
jgi:hypothetical protein